MSRVRDPHGSRGRTQSHPPLRSIYTTPSRSLNQILLHSERRSVSIVSGTSGARIEDTDVNTESVYRQGALKGWRNRRTRVGLRSQQSSSPEPTDLPNNDVIRTLHSHSAQFYSECNLLSGPRRQTRTPWETKKRKLLETEGTIVSETHVNAGASVPGSRGPQQRLLSNHGHLDSRERDADPDGPKSTSRNLYKRRDMYRALDASSIIALGTLTEEYVQEELRRAGYADKHRAIGMDHEDQA